MRNCNKRSKSRKIRNKSTNLLMDKKKIVLIVGSSIGILLFSVVFALGNSINSKILPRIKINEIKVANLEIEDAYQTVKTEVEKRKEQEITLYYGEYETTISLKQLEVNIDTIEAVNQAYKVGRNKNILISNYEIIGTLLAGNRIEKEVTYDTEELQKAVEDIANKIPEVMKETSYYIEGENLILSSGNKGVVVKQEEVKDKIAKAIKQQIAGETIQRIEIPVEQKEPTPFDLEKIRQEIYKEAKDAYYDIEKNQLHSQVNGVDFAVSLEEAKQSIQESKEEYSIPLKITIPNVTTASLGEKAFPQELGRYSTRYDESNKNRTNNIKLASAKIDETILMPGETFSYNKIVGERTIKTGYKEAAVYMNGKVVDGIGGGICQVSSTLYNAVLDANLEIVKRTNHYFITGYVSASRDATVSYGTIDFQFKNNRTYPIKIECTAKNGVSQIIIHGIQEETEYEVVIQDEITEVIPYTTKYIDTNTLEKGTENVIQKGTNGYKSQAYKIVKLNGKVISKTLLSKDSYHSMEKVIQRGTK